MRIDKVIIQNFKNYYGKIEFILDKEITIIWGENGFGKSTFFDAIEWCLTGGVSRFKNNKIRNEELISVRCDNNSICSVEIITEDFKISRSFKKNNNTCSKSNVSIDKYGEILFGEENVKNTLLGIFNKYTQENNGIRYYKESRILSQQQITDFVTSVSPKERYKALADIMGYSEALAISKNIEMFLNAVNERISKKRDLISSIEQQIATIEKGKYDIDKNKFYYYLEKYEIKIINGKCENDIKLKISNNMKELLEIQQSRKILSDSIYKKYKNYAELLLHYKKLKHEIDVANKEKYFIHKKKCNYKKYNGPIEEIEKLHKELYFLNDKDKEIQNYLKQEGLEDISIEWLEEKIKKCEGNIHELQFAISNYEAYWSYEKEIADIKNRINYISELIKRLNQEKQKLVQRYNESSYPTFKENMNNSMMELLPHIKAIKNILEKDKLICNHICQICSVKHNDNIVNKIEVNIKKIEDTIEYSNKINELEVEAKIKENERSYLIKKLENILENRSRLYDDENCNINLFIFNCEFLEDEIDCNTKIIEKYHQGIKIKTQKEFNDKKIKELKEKIKYNDNFLENNADINKYGKNEKDMNLDNQLIVITDKIENMKKNELLINDKIIKFNNLKLRDHNLNFEKIKRDLAIREEELENIHYQLDDLNNLQRYNEINNRIDGQTYNLKKQLKKEESILKKSMDVYLDTELKFKEYFRNFSFNMESQLNCSNSIIQNYFNFLDPLPYNKKLVFESTEDELYIKINNISESLGKQVTFEAEKVLSSGQLNILAISIFLALNESSLTDTLNFVAIDDPIQNMDDINQFSICDVLGMIKKQLIFSTHDYEFLKLFIKKNEKKKAKMQVYRLKNQFLTKDDVNRILF